MYKFEKMWWLDCQILFKLYIVIVKVVVGEGWGVQKVVKFMMVDIGGKRGEMVMGMVFGKDKGGIVDIEMFDIDIFISFVYGEWLKWLWYGKVRRIVFEQFEWGSLVINIFSRGELFQEVVRCIYLMFVVEEMSLWNLDDSVKVYLVVVFDFVFSVIESFGYFGEKDVYCKGVFKSVVGKMSDV